MSQQTIINVTCDGENCTHVRSKDANHWLVGIVTEVKSCMQGDTQWKPEGQVILLASKREILPDGYGNNPHVSDFCGEECAIKWVSKMLTEIKG